MSEQLFSPTACYFCGRLAPTDDLPPGWSMIKDPSAPWCEDPVCNECLAPLPFQGVSREEEDLAQIADVSFELTEEMAPIEACPTCGRVIREDGACGECDQ